MIWIDNYDSMFRTRFANIAKEAFRDNHWTGVAVRQHAGSVNMNVVRNDNGEIIPAMPDDPLVYADRALALVLSGSTGPAGGAGVILNKVPELLSTSLLMTWGVDRIPLRPSATNPKVPQRYRDAITRAPDSLANFYAVGLMPENIGSNLGLARVLRGFYDDHHLGADKGERYFSFTMDMNIHKRTLRVTNNFTN